ncbi:MAG: pantetheine-phosphate adenylyltransferase [bacterium]
MKNIAVYPGTFDPFTNGHLDIIARARLLFDTIIVAVTDNRNKKFMFSADARVEMIKTSVAQFGNVKADRFTGLLVHYMKSKKSRIIIRGLRAVSDFEYEFQMALMNRNLDSDIEAIFLMPDEKYTYLSSSLVKEIARLGGDIAEFVPAQVKECIIKQINF